MKVKMFALMFALCASLLLSAASAQEKENAPPPPAPAGEERSPSDTPPVLGRAVQGPQQAPEKQAPASGQAPEKSASYDAGPLHTVSYAPQCSTCQVSRATAPATTTNYPRTASSRRGLLRRSYR